MKSFELHALPGFLGINRDWESLASLLQPHHLISYDLCRDPFLIPEATMVAWIQKFLQTLKPHGLPRILVGYSLGGRLAMHLLLHNPSLWHAAILISAHPGLSHPNERHRRLNADHEWATRFRNEPWETVMNAWNLQDVFKRSSFHFEREAQHYQREQLANILELWSLGNQQDLSEQIKQLPLPILWIAGENDANYRLIANQTNFSHPLSQVWIAPQAGHRVPWEQTISFREKLQQFLISTEEL